MNNSKIALDNIEEQPDRSPMLRQRETELASIIEAIEHIRSSDYWEIVKNKILNSELLKIQRRLNKEKNPTEVYRLQGKMELGEKYFDLDGLSQVYKNELQSIRKQLNG